MDSPGVLALGKIRFLGSCRNTRHAPGSHQTTATLLRCVADYKLSILPPMRTTFRTQGMCKVA